MASNQPQVPQVQVPQVPQVQVPQVPQVPQVQVPQVPQVQVQQGLHQLEPVHSSEAGYETHNIWDLIGSSDLPDYLDQTPGLKQNIIDQFLAKTGNTLQFTGGITAHDDEINPHGKNAGAFIHFNIIFGDISNEPTELAFHFSFHFPLPGAQHSNLGQTHIKFEHYITTTNSKKNLSKYINLKFVKRKTKGKKGDRYSLYNTDVEQNIKTGVAHVFYHHKDVKADGRKKIVLALQELIYIFQEEVLEGIFNKLGVLSDSAQRIGPGAKKKTRFPTSTISQRLDWQKKYLKYKQKYLQLKKQLELEGKLKNLKI